MFAQNQVKSAAPPGFRAGTLSSARGASQVPGQCGVSLLQSWDSQSSTWRGAATAGCSAATETPRASWTLASTQTGDAPGSIGPTSGTIPALQRAPGSPSLDSERGSPPRGSGREGGVSGAGGRAGGSCIKSTGGAAARASFAVCHRDESAAGKQRPRTGRCARATQCWDYLQPLLVQYAGAPEQLNGVATPLPGLDRSAAFPYEEDTSE